jgi:hypothetical protein
MTPAEEARFIALWNAGTTTAAMAQQLGIPRGTVSSRAYTLVRQGKIQARPKGGNYPRQQRQAALARVSSDTPTVQYLPPNSGELSPLLLDILQELRHLTGALADRVSTDTPGVPHDTPRVSKGVSAGVSTRTPLPTERGKSVRWNLHLSERLRDQIKVMAAMRGLQDSQMVEELLWLALSIVETSPTKGEP